MDLGSKLISMGYDDNGVFKNAKIGVIVQMKKIVTPFMIGVLCFVHQTKLVMLVLLKFSLVAWLEVLLQAMHVFFSHSFKKFLEFQKLCHVFTEKQNKLFKNVKMRCINMLSPMKCVMEQYRPLMAKMHVDASRNLLCDLELVLRLHEILLLLDSVYTLIKLAQSRDVFVCDFIDIVKAC